LISPLSAAAVIGVRRASHHTMLDPKGAHRIGAVEMTGVPHRRRTREDASRVRIIIRSSQTVYLGRTMMRNRFPRPARLSTRHFRPIPEAFTLIELLVVIGIIAILMALLLTSLEVVRHRGYIAKCAANLHTIGQA